MESGSSSTVIRASTVFKEYSRKSFNFTASVFKVSNVFIALAFCNLRTLSYQSIKDHKCQLTYEFRIIHFRNGFLLHLDLFDRVQQLSVLQYELHCLLCRFNNSFLIRRTQLTGQDAALLRFQDQTIAIQIQLRDALAKVTNCGLGLIWNSDTLYEIGRWFKDLSLTHQFFHF